MTEAWRANRPSKFDPRLLRWPGVFIFGHPWARSEVSRSRRILRSRSQIQAAVIESRSDDLFVVDVTTGQVHEVVDTNGTHPVKNTQVIIHD